MNKEEIEKMYNILEEQWGDSDNYINDLLQYSKNLEKENKKLKEELEEYKQIIIRSYHEMIALNVINGVDEIEEI